MPDSDRGLRRWRRPRGRPIFGAIAGMLLGLFLAADLLLAGVFRLDSPLVVALPPAWALLGFMLGWIAPLRRRHATGDTQLAIQIESDAPTKASVSELRSDPPSHR